MTASADGVLCLDMPGCNDVMLVYNGTAGAGFFSLTGYEYGCGYPERGLDGSARVDGNTIYIAWTEVISSTSATSPRIQQYNVQYSTATKSGPAQYAVHYDGYHQGSGTALGVTCPVSEEYVPSIEVDTVQ
jgi:hypothetical protein